MSNFCDSTAAKLFCELLLRTFHVKSEMLEGVRAGRRIYTVKYECNAIYDFLLRMENNEAETLSELVGFRCDGCRSSFLRGVFIAMGSVSDPQKTYHLEISLPSERRADLVASLMSALMGRVGRIKRGQRYSVYYKNNGAILDFLYFIGCAPAALLGHIKQKVIQWKTTAWCIVGGVPTAILVSLLLQEIDTNLLHRLFGIFLLFIGIREWRAGKQDK